MRSCPRCGGSSPAGAQWCGLCYLPFAAEPSAPVTQPAAVAPAPALAYAGPPPPPPPPPPVAPAPVVPPPIPSRFGYLPPPPPPPPSPPVAAVSARTGMDSGRALRVTGLAIGVGAVGMTVSWLLGRNTSMEPATYIRYAIAITVSVYALVATIVVTQLKPGRRLRWSRGNPAAGILFGAAVGGGVSGLLLTLISAASGHLSSDPRIVTIMSEGDVAHLAAAVGLTCVAAPLVEEVLFRGLLLETMRVRGTAAAVATSAVAFAIWHLNPAALRYYALMGALFGVLYVKRGLACSMAAHATFNGVLTAAAMAIVLAPPQHFTDGRISVDAPSGWSRDSALDAGFPTQNGLALHGPSGAEFLANESLTMTTPTLDTIEGQLSAGALGALGVDVDGASIHTTRLPIGMAVEASVTAQGHHGTIVVQPRGQWVLEVVFFDAGSIKAQADFGRMLASVRAPAS